MNEVMLVFEASEQRERKEWERTRFLGYMIYRSVADSGKAVSMYEFLPLSGDPTPEEIQRQKEIQYEEDIKSFEQAREFYKSKGFLN